MTDTQNLLASLVRELGAEDDVLDVWRRTIEAAVAQIEGAEYAGITELNRTSVSTPVASDELVRLVDKVQYTTGQGPCLHAAVDRAPVVRVDDLRTDTRWPDFAAGAAALGVLSMLSFEIYTHDETMGAINLYATAPNAFTDESVQTGQLLAAHAAVAASATMTEGNLRLALVNRDVIGQAKGILMERFKITSDQAFGLLLSASQRTHRKLSELATELADTGELRFSRG